jgi:hypothetical protein
MSSTTTTGGRCEAGGGHELVCVECGVVSTHARGWEAHLTDDEPPEIGL